MSIQWTFIAGFLYFEVGLLIVLLLPFMSPVKLQRLINSNLIGVITHYSTMYVYILVAVLSLFLVDAVRDMMKYSRAIDTTNYASEMKTSIKLFRSQRNFYITFFSLFLVFIIKRLVTILDTQATLVQKAQVLEKQKSEAEVALGKKEKMLLNQLEDHKSELKLLQEQVENLSNGNQVQEECQDPSE